MTKTIENKQTDLPLENGKARYADLLKVIIDKPIKEGITVSEMRRDIGIITILDKSKLLDTIEFSAEEFKHLAELTKQSVWGIRHVEILDFVDYIASL